MISHTTVSDADADARWRAWQERGVASAHRSNKRMLLLLAIAAGVGVALFAALV